jgi:hypothetical protein
MINLILEIKALFYAFSIVSHISGLAFMPQQFVCKYILLLVSVRISVLLVLIYFSSPVIKDRKQ